MKATAPQLGQRFGTRRPRWRRRLALWMRGPQASLLLEFSTLALLLGMMGVAYAALNHGGAPQKLLTPALVSLLLVGTLVPAMGLLVLLAMRVARARAAHSPLGGRGQLHVRLVAFFSAIAALPTLLVVIFASLLFQYGVQFWLSDRARTVLENADKVAQTYVKEHRDRLANENVAMAGDILRALNDARPDDPRWDSYFASQVFYRLLDQAAMIRVAKDGSEQLIWGANLDKRPLEKRLPPANLPNLADDQPHTRVLPDRLESVVRFDKTTGTYLWVSRNADPLVLAQAGRANSAINDYSALLDRSRTVQFRFNLALFAGSLLIVAIAIWVALAVADRLVRPIGDLVGAARRVAGGDLSARVTSSISNDEVGTLAAAFNRMTRRLQEQTGALESRRALTEAVLSGVSAGVISVDADGVVTIINPSADAMLRTEGEAIGARLELIAPELAALMASGEREAVIQLAAGGELRTLAVTVGRAGAGPDSRHVLTFDDITQQLSDQRRAAWADVARRIAHEIKNPLTPIQLAAERLQRRYGRDIADDGGTFERLVSTIVRQVGDIRRMIDEFSAFARMPKPSFAEEPIVDIARETFLLAEVAHPNIHFTLDAAYPGPVIVCDRRQLGQALTNIVKNGIEAIEARLGDEPGGELTLAIGWKNDGRLSLVVSDNGVGLPAERERLTEPYMTTRAKGTGLGLAIVEKIVEDHLGQMSFADREGGGAVVRLCLDPAALAPLADGEGASSDERSMAAE